jgi:hypothetical protein
MKAVSRGGRAGGPATYYSQALLLQAPGSSHSSRARVRPILRSNDELSNFSRAIARPFGLTCLSVWIGVVGAGPSGGAPLDEALRRLGKELDRRCWGMVLGMRVPVPPNALEPGADVVEVFPRGTEPVSGAADRRAVDGPVERLEVMRLLSDAIVVLPGGVDVLADLLALLTEQALGLGDKPCAVLDLAGLLDPLAEQLDALDRANLLSAPLLRADDPAQLLDQLAAWRRPNGGADLREEVAWLRTSDSSLALVPTSAGLGLPGGLRRPGERGALALCRLMDQHWSVRLCPERLRPVAALMVPDIDGWRRVNCYRADGQQPVVPGAVSHPLGETAHCDPAAAALQDLLRRGHVR